MARRFRTLRLSSPYMSGLDVVRMQRALGVPDDGEFGPVTASSAAVAEMERWAALSVRERPPGSDRVPALVRLGEKLGLTDFYFRMGYPWCAYAAFLAALKGRRQHERPRRLPGAAAPPRARLRARLVSGSAAGLTSGPSSPSA